MVNISDKFPLKNISINKVYLFGSQLIKSNFNDIDLLIISEEFESLSRIKRIEKITLNFTENIDPVCLSLKEYDRLLKAGSTFLKLILVNASKIYDRQVS